MTTTNDETRSYIQVKPRVRPWILALKALELGIPVRLGNIKYVMGEDPKGNKILGIPTVSESAEGKTMDEVALDVDMDVNTFLKLCSEIPADDLFALAANVALNETKLGKQGRIS